MDEKYRSETQIRIIYSAGPLFAEYGLRGTRTREITEQARVNVAGINYHFGSKENLYNEIIEHIFDKISYVNISRLWHERPAGIISEKIILEMVYNYLDINFTNFYKSNHPLWYFKIIHRSFIDSKLALKYLYEKLYKTDFNTVKNLHQILHNKLSDLEIDAWLTLWYTQTIGLNILIPLLTTANYNNDTTSLNFKDTVLHYTYMAIASLFKTAANHYS